MATIAGTIKANPALKACGQDYPKIEKLGNLPTSRANPDAGKKITTDARITREDIIANVAPADAWIVYSTAGGLKEDLFAAIDADNRPWLTYLLGVAIASNKLSQPTITNLQTLLAKKVETTAPATLADDSIFAKAGLGYVTAAAIQAADVAGGSWA